MAKATKKTKGNPIAKQSSANQRRAVVKKGKK